MKISDSTTTHLECSKPPPLSDSDLLTYIDGEAAQSTQEHLDGCAYCSTRLKEISDFEHTIQTAMARIDCASAEKLADYTLQLLNANEIAEIRSHLDDCRRCRDEVELLRATFVIDEMSVGEQIVDLVKDRKSERIRSKSTYMERILVPQTPSAYGQMKGGGGPQSRVYSSDFASVMLLVEPSGGRLKLNGTISDLEMRDRWHTGLAELISVDGGELRYTTLIDEDESFTLDQVVPGIYSANFFATDGRILRLRDIEVTV